MRRVYGHQTAGSLSPRLKFLTQFKSKVCLQGLSDNLPHGSRREGSDRQEGVNEGGSLENVVGRLGSCYVPGLWLNFMRCINFHVSGWWGLDTVTYFGNFMEAVIQLQSNLPGLPYLHNYF